MSPEDLDATCIDTHRTQRGGGWCDGSLYAGQEGEAPGTRAAMLIAWTPMATLDDLGFRLVSVT